MKILAEGVKKITLKSRGALFTTRSATTPALQGRCGGGSARPCVC